MSSRREGLSIAAIQAEIDIPFPVGYCWANPDHRSIPYDG
jgi:hypothetical protein